MKKGKRPNNLFPFLLGERAFYVFCIQLFEYSRKFSNCPKMGTRHDRK
jgi:hypothetical protein